MDIYSGLGSAAIATVVKTVVSELCTPFIKGLAGRKLISAKPSQLSDVYANYLITTYTKLSYISTIVFPNQQKRFFDLYIPLTLRPRDTKIRIKLDADAPDFIPQYKKIIVTDTAGMGKSTILKWIFMRSVGIKAGAPIFLELRSLTSTLGVLSKICREFGSASESISEKDVETFLKEGQFIFLFDGLDEVAHEHKAAVLSDLQNFITLASKSYFVISSRHETASLSFPQFKEFNITHLTKTEAYELLNRYDETKEYSTPLITQLEAGSYEQLGDLLTNPMVVSLLFKAFSYKPTIPIKKHVFYSQVFDALYDTHDATKGGAFSRIKKSCLDIDDFHTILRHLGFDGAKLGIVEFQRVVLCDALSIIQKRTGISFNPADFLYDLVTTVPLFNKEGTYFRWAHKSVQDYFASQFLAFDAKENQTAILNAIIDGGHIGRFTNILEMFSETDRRAYRRRFLKGLLTKYTNQFYALFPSGIKGVDRSLINDRKYLILTQTTALIQMNDSEVQPGPSNDNMIFIRVSKRFEQKLKRRPSRSTYNTPQLVIATTENAFSDFLEYMAPADFDVKWASEPFVPYLDVLKLADLISTIPDRIALVDDDPTNIINQPKHFKKFSSLLSSVVPYIQIDEAQETLDQINKEMDDPSDLSTLLKGLA